MPDQSTVSARTICANRPVANPRRLRIGRDGRPLPVPAVAHVERDTENRAA